jgi:DNA repair protein RecN (Recombination protein N)
VLSRLTIRNFAIIDHLEVEWSRGLNVITGETGAGKSILIDAVGALLGDRLGAEVVRSGASRALIEGVFTLPNALPQDLAETLAQMELEPEDGALIVNREIAGGGGRGLARINGRGVPLSVLQGIGERLVDVHGQSEHMALLRAREQLDYLDRYAGLLAERSEVARLVRDLRAARAEFQDLVASERETARLQDMLRHEIGEIESASLSPGEEAELHMQRSRLEHVEHLRELALTALSALARDDDDRAGAADLLSAAVAALHEASRTDATLDPEAEALESARDQALEAVRSLRDYVDSLETDPEALQNVVERQFRISDLKRKYGDSVADVLAYAESACQRLTEVENRTQRVEELRNRADELDAQLRTAAEALSAGRRAAATRLAAAVCGELRDLRLPEAAFDIAVEPTEVDSTGADRVEFRLTEDGRALARVASGGELARVALALKTVLTRAETRPTLIFDEVDVGVGGRTAPVVGQKLWSVSEGGHQVLCVTHMPQVAAFADSHYAVSRAGGEVGVTELGGDARLDELAAMLAGTVSNASRASAKELLTRAAALKRGFQRGPKV